MMATATDVLMFGALVFAFGIGFFIFHFAANTVVDDMLATSAINSTNATVDALQSTKDMTERLDYIVFAVFIGLLIGLIVTGYLIGGHPVFMGMYFLVALIGVIISTVLANTWEEITAMAIFGTTITSFPISNQLIMNLPIYVAIAAFIGIIVMFAKPVVNVE